MRFICFLILFTLACNVKAVEARILVNNDTREESITGSFKLQCKVKTGYEPCSMKFYDFPLSQWKLIRDQKGLIVQSLKSKKMFPVPGESFYLLGEMVYRGKKIHKLHLNFNKDETQWIVRLPVDQYLQGVLSGEVPASWPKESLRAQAIASRTYFLFKKQENEKKAFDVRSDIMDQVFHISGDKHKSIIDAVNKTRGLVLVSKKNKNIFPAYFHSDCGGHTSSEKAVWRKPSSLNKIVKDPYCKTASKNNWSLIMDKVKLMELLQSAFHISKEIQLKHILPRFEKESRAHIIDFMFSNNDVKRMDANELRKIIGFGKLKSTQFSVKKESKEFVFTGRGYGHGVGMCQWGAQRWARKGKTFRQILRHYYPGAKMIKHKLFKNQLAGATIN